MRKFDYTSDDLDDGPVVRTYEGDQEDSLHQALENKRRELTRALSATVIRNISFKWANVQSTGTNERMRGVLEVFRINEFRVVQTTLVENGVEKRVFINLNTPSGIWGQIRVTRQQSDRSLAVTFQTDCESAGYCLEKLYQILDGVERVEVRPVG